MHFRCKCGNSISNTTDFLPYAARVVADVNLEDYWEAWERRGRGQALGNLMNPLDYEQTIYQCEECGRIWFDDPEDPAYFISFVPDDKNVMVTGPIEGKKWKGYIYGFSDLGIDCSIGSCFTCWHNGKHREEHSFESYADMRAYFDVKAEELKGQDLLRRAWIVKDGETIYRWTLDDEVPVQEKHELYLTEDERIALAEFQTEHAECHRKHPRGPRGWNFAYEILPGICGADDRDLKATCLRCGATVESIDGKIMRNKARRARDVAALVAVESGDKREDLLALETWQTPKEEAIAHTEAAEDLASVNDNWYCAETESELAELLEMFWGFHDFRIEQIDYSAAEDRIDLRLEYDTHDIRILLRFAGGVYMNFRPGYCYPADWLQGASLGLRSQRQVVWVADDGIDPRGLPNDVLRISGFVFNYAMLDKEGRLTAIPENIMHQRFRGYDYKLGKKVEYAKDFHPRALTANAEIKSTVSNSETELDSGEQLIDQQ